MRLHISRLSTSSNVGDLWYPVDCVAIGHVFCMEIRSCQTQLGDVRVFLIELFHYFLPKHPTSSDPPRQSLWSRLQQASWYQPPRWNYGDDPTHTSSDVISDVMPSRDSGADSVSLPLPWKRGVSRRKGNILDAFLDRYVMNDQQERSEKHHLYHVLG